MFLTPLVSYLFMYRIKKQFSDTEGVVAAAWLVAQLGNILLVKCYSLASYVASSRVQLSMPPSL